MKRKKRNIDHENAKEETIPDWLGGEDLVEPPDWEELEEELDDHDLPANVEKGIRDLPVWQDLVARVGIDEARKILRRGLMVNRIIDGNPKN